MILSLHNSLTLKLQSNKQYRTKKELREREGAGIIRNNTEKQQWLCQL